MRQDLPREAERRELLKLLKVIEHGDVVSDAKLFANRSALFANDAESAMIACSLL